MRSYIIDIVKRVFSKQGKATPIIFLGDSQTANFKQLKAYKNIANLGVHGAGATQLLEMAKEVIIAKPEKVFIQVGVNELLSGFPAEDIAHQIQALAREINAGSPETRIYLQSVLPTNWFKYGTKERVFPQIIELNNLIERICVNDGLQFIDLYPYFLKGEGLNEEHGSGDSLHLNSRGYTVWWEAIKHLVY